MRSLLFNNALKIPYLPEEILFIIYLGDSSEQKQIGIDAEGNPICETVIVGSFI